MNKLIQKTWDKLKVELHGLPQNKGRELEHINGRDGCFLACKLLIIPLSKKQHKQEHADSKMRTDNMELIREITLNWHKYYGCQKEHNVACKTCPLLAIDKTNLV